MRCRSRRLVHWCWWVGSRTLRKPPNTGSIAARILVVLRVDLFEDDVRIAARDIGLDPLLTALCEIVDHAGASVQQLHRPLEFRPSGFDSSSDSEIGVVGARPLLDAAIDWVRAVLRVAVGMQTRGHGDIPGLTVNTTTVSESLARSARTVLPDSDVEAAAAALSRALAMADGRIDPLAIAARTLGLTALEFRLLVLALGPELDARYQRCIGLLMDDLSRRVGTLGLYAGLLGDPAQVRQQLASSGNLIRWRVIEGQSAGLPHADEPLRLDPSLVGWLLGADDELDHDPHVRRIMSTRRVGRSKSSRPCRASR